jgi:cellulose synthase (UDP-forming)
MVLSALEAAFAPSLVVAGIALSVLPFCSRSDTRVRAVLFSVSVFLGWRYIVWRLGNTLPAPALDGDFVFGCVFMILETLVMLGSTCSSLILVRTRDRSSDATANANWWPVERPPQVDVFITTYNEEESILARTIAGALGIQHPKLRVWVLDDGRREWLRDLCAARQVGYLTRPDNSHAKAGNINNGLAHLASLEAGPEFIVVLDADFVVHDNFVSRTLALFHDPTIGLVQTPQHFFNSDPIQSNLRIGQAYPDEQRFFFDDLMASRDAWGIAFCCGTSSMIRWEGLQAIGGFPTDSVTEDFLVTLRLKQHGLRTVYLNERLSDGLAPEGLKEYVTQRGRWCLGFMQIIRGPLSPFRPNRLDWMDRFGLIDALLYWGSTFYFRLACLLVPALYWLFGISAVNASFPEVVAYFIPYFIAVMVALNWTTGGKVIPIMNDVSQILTMFEINRAVLAGLLRPQGQKFKVTAKGGARNKRFVQWIMLLRFGTLCLITIGGMLYAMISDYAPDGGAGDGKLVVLFWSFYNLAVLLLAMIVCVELPRLRADERYPTHEEVQMEVLGDLIPARLIDVSLTGARVQGSSPVAVGDGFLLHLASVGLVPVTVVNARDGTFAVRFHHDAETRDRMTHKIYSDTYQLNVSRISWRGLLAGLGNRAME